MKICKILKKRLWQNQPYITFSLEEHFLIKFKKIYFANFGYRIDTETTISTKYNIQENYLTGMEKYISIFGYKIYIHKLAEISVKTCLNYPTWNTSKTVK